MRRKNLKFNEIRLSKSTTNKYHPYLQPHTVPEPSFWQPAGGELSEHPGTAWQNGSVLPHSRVQTEQPDVTVCAAHGGGVVVEVAKVVVGRGTDETPITHTGAFGSQELVEPADVVVEVAVAVPNRICAIERRAAVLTVF